MIGVLFIFIKCNINKLTKYSLAFSAGVMVSVSLLDLIKESLELFLKTNNKNISFIYLIIGIIVGIIISISIDKIIPTNNKVKNKNLYRVGVFSMLAIIMHNLPEGIITFITSSTNITLGITITIAILLHNITEGISIAVPVYASTESKSRAVGYTLISALAEPLGAVLAFLFLVPIITDNILAILLAITAGIMLYIGIFKLLKESLRYKNKFTSIIVFTIGILFMIISNIMLNAI